MINLVQLELLYLLKLFNKFLTLNRYKFFLINFYIYSDLYININITDTYLKLNNFFFFLKKKVFNTFNILNYNAFKFDLIFRFSKISYIQVYNFRRSLSLIRNLNQAKSLANNYSLKNLFFKLTPIAGIGAIKQNLFKRLNQLTVGSFDYLPLNYTYSGYFMPILIKRKKKQFFTKITEFLFIRKYKIYDSELNVNFFKFKKFNIFPLKAPNINLKVLLFYTGQRSMNFIKNNITYKQYNLYKSYKNTIGFIKFNWLNNNKQDDTSYSRTPFANIKSKKKHLLKFYRIASNDFFKTRFRSHTLTHIYNYIDLNLHKDYLKYTKNELTLLQFLIRINFALNTDDSHFLIKNGYVFINGKVCYNYNFIVKIFDRIQLINYNEEYIYHIFIISSNITKKARMWFTVRRLSLTHGKHYKTQPNLRKKWPIKVMWHLMDLPRFVEIDFITFTAIIIYQPVSCIDFFKFFKEDYKPEFFRMYNWKYYY